MTEAATDRPKRNWLGVVVSAFLGIAATIGVGWYQLYQAEKQAILAEEERARAVRQNLVAIVEEHVLNDRPIDLPRLTRLIDQRRRDERITTPITTAELLEKAEFNILESRYLAFERKQALKKVFDTVYFDLSTRSFAQYPPATANADLLNTLAGQIKDGKTAEALGTLKRLQEAHAKDLQETGAGRPPKTLSDALNQLLKDPWPIVATLVAYILFLIWVVRRRPEVIRRIGRILGSRPTRAEVQERITRYVRDGMPDDQIVARLMPDGAHASFVLAELARQRASETRSGDSMISESAKPPVEQANTADQPQR